MLFVHKNRALAEILCIQEINQVQTSWKARKKLIKNNSYKDDSINDKINGGRTDAQ